jgi:copper homeostasis protein (lipoprotein)
LLILGCNQPEIERPATEPDDVIGTSTRWMGTLPCADCGGILYDLELNAETGRFTLTSTYLATKDGDRTYTRTGRYSWTETIVCTLPQPPEPEECFMLKDVDTLLKLDRAGNVIESLFSYELKRDKG